MCRVVVCLRHNTNDHYRLIFCLKAIDWNKPRFNVQTPRGNDFLPHEQKVCKRIYRGTKDQLLVNKTVLRQKEGEN